eukprot:TRINITY_DN2397_c0_g1_i2.p1 TRINITY_DN2397_c0_g1~~TRINITY_DN2397_c0_g1_i2.p1  ORF type:complete len:789 (-),score=263.76 TRINITY_DN2397_c0_g1_i2:58-2424(-)
MKKIPSIIKFGLPKSNLKINKIYKNNFSYFKINNIKNNGLSLMNIADKRFYSEDPKKNSEKKEEDKDKDSEDVFDKWAKKLGEDQKKEGESNTIWDRLEERLKNRKEEATKKRKETEEELSKLFSKEENKDQKENKNENESENKENEKKKNENNEDPSKTLFEMLNQKNKKNKEEENDGENDPFKKHKNSIIMAFVATLGLVGLVVLGQNSNKITFHEFQNEILPKGIVTNVTVENQDIAKITLSEPYKNQTYVRVQIGSPHFFERQLTEAQYLLGVPQEQHIVVNYSKSVNFLPFINAVVLLGTILGISYLSISRGSSGFSLGRPNSKTFSPVKDIKVKFQDVAGHHEAKQEVSEFVSFLTDPKKFKALGARTPKGALLIGPPGSAVAGEANVPFYSVSGSDFVEVFVGVGPQRVRDLFKTARKTSPCIVFIDEIDAIGRARSDEGGGNDERENTLHQLLVEMDGFEKEGDVIVLASTNRADILDKALMRPGRFDRQIAIDNPDLLSRKEILHVHIKKIKVDPKTDMEKLIEKIALLTPGFSGADLANVCNEAALVSARNQKEFVSFIELEYAIDRVIAGMERKTRVLSEEEKKVVAYHEAGHAISGWFLKHVDPILKVSIIPRGESTLGFAQYNPKDQYLYTKEQLVDRICMALGGRVAEEIFFGKVTTGASDDLRRVTEMAYSQVCLYGMNENIGPVSFPHFSNLQMIGKPYSEKTAVLIDNEVKSMVDIAYERTKNLLLEKKEMVEGLALLLIKDEVVNRDQIEQLVGPREEKKFIPPILPNFN